MKGYKGHRVTVALLFLVLVACFPLLFLFLRDVVAGFFSAFHFDDRVCLWIDGVFRLPTDIAPETAVGTLQKATAGGSHRWLIEVATLFPTLWCLRFLTGAVEEIRSVYGGASPLHIIEVFGRWIALAALLQVTAPVVAVLFFHSVRFVVWEPLAFLMAVSVFLFLLGWGWQYPNGRLKHVRKIYHFERLKQEGTV
ncbi:hypothetical protein N836_07230 [Leptolyngbya sp. Heron Island J]|uniref:hypothetical protein n=1 Tax=Leptolyngbya sp. Heron Island J TaxID=1385935 RepID=UPI0003B9D6D5|nr:hypothetical protein [Leptolyngbya sp. Heron Island J]ESA36559.1 hypothetical protein N836_07230 [Leptolyngbya sp. Heron Island J]